MLTLWTKWILAELTWLRKDCETGYFPGQSMLLSNARPCCDALQSCKLCKNLIKSLYTFHDMLVDLEQKIRSCFLTPMYRQRFMRWTDKILARLTFYDRSIEIMRVLYHLGQKGFNVLKSLLVQCMPNWLVVKN